MTTTQTFEIFLSFLIHQLAAKCTLSNDYEADFQEFPFWFLTQDIKYLVSLYQITITKNFDFFFLSHDSARC